MMFIAINLLPRKRNLQALVESRGAGAKSVCGFKTRIAAASLIVFRPAHSTAVREPAIATLTKSNATHKQYFLM